jgi:hypothetical protein
MGGVQLQVSHLIQFTSELDQWVYTVTSEPAHLVQLQVSQPISYSYK